MMKKIYVGSWILLAVVVLGSVLNRTITPGSALIYSLLALGLVFTMMLWSVIVNTREIKTEQFD
jgi:hypothetical protein